jgi:RecA/RadA recombinase
MSDDTSKKTRGRPRGSGKKVNSKESNVTSADSGDIEFDSIEAPPVSNDDIKIDYGFHFIDSDEDYGDKYRIALENVASRKKGQSISFKSMAEVQEGFAFPLKHFLLQQAVGQYGIPPQKIIDIIGAEGIGKTTLVMQMLGWAMDVGCPSLYIECESKQIPPARVMRALHPNVMRAYKMLQRLRVEPVNSLDHMWQVMKDFVYVARGTRGDKDTPRIPMHVPIVIAVDPWSKLLNPEEAAGFYNYGDNMSEAKKKKFKEINEGSNLGHSKWAHKWCRLLPAFLKQYNVSLIIVHHQNDKVDMAGGGAASYMTAEASALYNKTRIGGRALHQNTALTVILSRRGLSKNTSGDVVGNLISARIAKNSLGPDNSKFFYELRTGYFNDSGQTLDPAINMNVGFANMCAEQKWLSTTVKGSKFSSPVLGVNEVTADEFYAAFDANADIKINLGKQLGINGYVDIVDKVKATINKNYHTEHQESIESEYVPEAVSEEDMNLLRAKMESSYAAEVELDTSDEHIQNVLDAIGDAPPDME